LYHVDITKPAENDIYDAAKYIAEQLLNPSAADRLIDDIEHVVNSLNNMPDRHPLVSDEVLARLGFRFIPVNNYLIFYIIREDIKTVVIQRFLYGRRDWVNILKCETD